MLYDNTNYPVTVHTREKDGRTEIIINRSCQTCRDFHQIGDGTYICNKCTYQQGWLELGLY